MSKTSEIKVIHVPLCIHKLVFIVGKNICSRYAFIQKFVVLQWPFLWHNLLMSVDNPHGFPVQEGISRWGWRAGELSVQREVFLKAEI